MNNITFLTGDATAPEGAGQKIIAHVCNNMGAWGAGFVMALSERWRQPQREYQLWASKSRDRLLRLGEVQFVRVSPDITVANIIGQHGTRPLGNLQPIRYEAMVQGLTLTAIRAIETNASVHAPRLGCGLAGGEWRVVEQLLRDAVCARGVPVFIYDLPRQKEAAA